MGRVFRVIAVLVLTAVLAGPRCFGTATLTITSLPVCVIADNATEVSVWCAIDKGYFNNVYAIKGTFSGGDLPYYGLTYNPLSQFWTDQFGSWAQAQKEISTDSKGKWQGWLHIRLETTAPRGSVLFRFSAVPLQPISNPGPTVSDWIKIYSMDGTAAGGAGWLSGHVYLDAECTQPADNLVIRAWDNYDGTGHLLGAYLSQNSHVADGGNHSDHGYFRVGVEAGDVVSITARSASDPTILVPVYVQTPGPWTVAGGQTTTVDTLPWGDVNGDASLTVADVVETLQIAAGFADTDWETFSRADVEPLGGDGVVDVTDAVAIARHLAGL